MITAEWFQRLRQSLEFAAGFELFLFVGPGALAEAGLRRLADDLGEFGTPRWHALHLDGLDGLLDASEPRVLHFVHGLEHLTPAAVRGVFARLNLERQRLLNIGAPVLLWVPENDYEEFHRQAPDLLAWRSQVEVVSASELGLAVAPTVDAPAPMQVLEPQPGRDRSELERSLPVGADDLLGERYRLIELLGVGGSATVWKAYDSHRRWFVAVKVLHDQWAEQSSMVARFNRGARTMAALEHPAIVPILDGPAQDGDRRYVVMPWYEGGDLHQAIMSEKIGRDAALLACARAFDGLEHAHALRLVHRDVKPANILLDAAGRGSMTGFGLVLDKSQTHGVSGGMGTFGYAAPEQFEDADDVDSRADVYGAGMCTLFSVTGENPPVFPLLRKPNLLEELPISEDLREALRGALAYDPDQRTTTLAQLIAAIREFVATSGDTTHSRAPAWSEEGEDAHGRWASVRISDVDLRMRWIEPGTFLMGSPASEPGRFDNEGPQHQVTLTQGFWLSETPCTQALWQAVMGNNPSHFPSPTRPVEQVSWDDARRFLFELSERLSGPPFQLPTEAQWEYACRAGTTTPTNVDAWTWQTSGGTTHPVACNAPNAWGLHDMLGNVWEWCADGPRHYTAEPVTDPLGPGVSERVRRGGSWGSDARFARAACRDRHDPSDRYGSVGFRIARGGR